MHRLFQRRFIAPILCSSITVNVLDSWYNATQNYKYIHNKDLFLKSYTLNDDFTVTILVNTYIGIFKGLIYGITFPISIPCKIYTTLYNDKITKEEI